MNKKIIIMSLFVIMGIIAISGCIGSNDTKTNNTSDSSSGINAVIKVPSEFEIDEKNNNQNTNNDTSIYRKLKTNNKITLEATLITNKTFTKNLYFKDGDSQEITNKSGNMYSFVDKENYFIGVSEVISIDGKDYLVSVYEELDNLGDITTTRENTLRNYLSEINELSNIEPIDPSNW